MFSVVDKRSVLPLMPGIRPPAHGPAAFAGELGDNGYETVNRDCRFQPEVAVSVGRGNFSVRMGWGVTPVTSSARAFGHDRKCPAFAPAPGSLPAKT